MIRAMEKAGAKLLGIFVPSAKASAGSADPKACYAYPACWQCNKANGGRCNYNAPCAVCSGLLLCDAC